MDLVKSFIGPFNSSALKDTAKLVIIGSTVEATRRASTSAWHSFVDSFFLTAHFSQEDYPYDWIMHWLQKQPSYSASREFDVGSSRTGSVGVDDVEGEEETEEANGRRRVAIAFLPSIDVTHSIFYHGHWLKITRSRRNGHYGGYHELKISVIARNNNILKQLVIQARREYEADMEHRVHVFLAEASSWRWNGAHQKRPLSSVVLEPGVKDMLIADAKDFLASEAWYADRGIPYRRGYLLYGVPGSGKTSLIHAIAGELSLDIYVVSLSAKGMSDNTLTTLLGRVPSRCILLLEDLDAAFTRSVTRDSKSTGIPTTTTTTTTTTTPIVATVPPPEDPNTLSLSGLLNSLDGVAASTGRLLFATTNHYERLDPALTRPGRLDVHVDFKHASKWQAEGIYKNFFPTKPKPTADGEVVEVAETQLGRKRKSHRHVVPLLEEEELGELAKQFAAAIPENEMSVAGLQGYLLRNKTRPREAVAEVGAWVEKEREAKAKLKKLKEEAEAEAKKEAEEKAAKEQKEKDEAEAKEKLEKAATEKKEKDEKDAERRKQRRSKRKASAKPEPAKAGTDSEWDSEAEAEVISPVPAAEPSPQSEISDKSALSESSSGLSTSSDTSSSSGDSSTLATSEDSATSSEVENDRVTEGETAAAIDDMSSSKWVAVQVPVVASTTTNTTPSSTESE